jgi:hypothetical protein
MNLRKELIKMTETKVIVFDMDGTIADLYGVDGWCEMLNNHIVKPYEIAKPLYDMVELVDVLNELRNIGYIIAITSWLAKNTTKEYDRVVRIAKKNWLDGFNFPYDELHLVKYGTTKANCTRKLGGFQILVDDNEKVRNGWNLGATIDANENIIEMLKALL